MCGGEEGRDHSQKKRARVGHRACLVTPSKQAKAHGWRRREEGGGGKKKWPPTRKKKTSLYDPLYDPFRPASPPLKVDH